jgi:hypothetical protein
MNSERMAYEIWRNHRTTRPGFDDRFLARVILRLDFIIQTEINIGAFFE